MTEKRTADVLVSGAKSALLHFGKAAIEVASGLTVLATSVAEMVRPGGENREEESGGPQKIEIE
ncbi:MAG: hypothetical protein V3S38_00700 [Acidimicrobiia bacterium]